MVAQLVPNAIPEKKSIFHIQATFQQTSASQKKMWNTELELRTEAFGKLMKRVFNNKNFNLITKIIVYTVIVISTLLYGCGAWTLHYRDIQNVESFHQ